MSNDMKILVSTDFKIQGIRFMGAYEASSGWLVGSVKDIKLGDLFHDDAIPDLEVDEISCGYSYKGQEYFFRTVLGVSINLSNLPLVGKVVSSDQTVSIDNLAIMVKGTRDPKNNPTGTGAGARPIVSISADINIGGETQKLELPIGGARPPSGVSRNEPAQTARAREESRAISPEEIGMTKWFAINKTFGPVSFKRVGVRYEKEGGKIFFLLDAAMSMGPLGLSLAGLGVGSSIKAFEPEFMLEGMGLSYSQSGILISGALLYDKAENYFTGCAIIKTPVICLAALGGYQSLDGQPSIFVYAVLSGAAGLITVNLGPVFFQVTGISAGFGFNRGLIVPDVQKIKEFPLVSVATGDVDLGKDPLDILRQVKTYIPAVRGELFLALGVKFNIQKLIDCFALLIVRIDRNIRLDIVGLAKVALPTEVSTPLAQVELAYKVTFNIDEGALQISAALTPASYIFTKDCRLTGGFAFYAWFYGEHAGEFVLTIGGYHPQFNVPAYYPRVPRVGFQWQLIPELSVKGELYCALTPSGMMAGGLLHAVFQFSRTVRFSIGICGADLTGMVKASFLIALDLMMAWQPFSYQAELKIAIGIEARFRGTAWFKAWFVKFSRTAERSFDLNLGANVRIWGPEFAGIAHVDWAIISFDIAFGHQERKEAPALDWDGFKQAFLPADTGICTMTVTDGLIRQVDETFVVNPAELVLTTNSVIPITTSNTPGNEKNGNSFGIGSMKIKDGVTSTQKITILDTDNNNINVTEQFHFEPIRKSVPAAMWGEDFEPKLNSRRLIDGMLMGFRITPQPKTKPEQTETTPVSDFSYEVEEKKDAYAWETQMKFMPDGGQISKINAQTINDERNKILNALGLTGKVSLSDNVAGAFLSPPEVGTLAA